MSKQMLKLMMFYLPEIPQSVIGEEERNFPNYCKVIQAMFVQFICIPMVEKIKEFGII